MRVKNFLSKAFILIFIFASLFSVVGCNKRDKIVRSESVVNVRVYKGGYGADWIYELKRRFEALYADEGYKMNILQPSVDNGGVVVLNELAAGNAKSGVDLYFTTGNPVDTVTDGDYGMLVEDITQTVMNKPAIKYDGTLESVNIADKMSPETLNYMRGSDGNIYGFNWVQSVAGFAVNTKKLAKYGLELPRTTDELFNCFDVIYKGTTHNGVTIPNSETSKTFPITYSYGNKYNNCLLNVMIAQYEGKERYAKFYSMQNDDGTDMKTDGYKVFEMDGVLEMLKIAYRAFDVRVASYGTTSQGLDAAQAQIMKESGDNAVFIANGDWMLNEVKLNYRNLNDIGFINFPVVSALGTKLFGSGTSYNLSTDKCEELLSYIIGLVDENKSVDEIIAAVQQNKSVSLDAESAQTIAEARGVYYSRGIEHQGYIAKGARAKDLAELVLRMYASEDFSKDFAKYSNGTSPYATEINNETEYEFVRQASAIAVNKYADILSPLTGFRKKMGLSNILTSMPNIPVTVGSQQISMYNNGAQTGTPSVYYDAAQTAFETEKTNTQSNWSTWLTQRGIS